MKYYHDIKSKHSNPLETLTSSMSNKVKFKWTGVKEKMFKEITHIVDCNNLLVYLDINKKLDTYQY